MSRMYPQASSCQVWYVMLPAAVILGASVLQHFQSQARFRTQYAQVHHVLEVSIKLAVLSM